MPLASLPPQFVPSGADAAAANSGKRNTLKSAPIGRFYEFSRRAPFSIPLALLIAGPRASGPFAIARFRRAIDLKLDSAALAMVRTSGK